MLQPKDLGKIVVIEGKEYELGKLEICNKCSSVLYESGIISEGKPGHQETQHAYTPVLIVDPECCGKEGAIWLPNYTTASLKDLQKHWPDARYI